MNVRSFFVVLATIVVLIASLPSEVPAQVSDWLKNQLPSLPNQKATQEYEEKLDQLSNNSLEERSKALDWAMDAPYSYALQRKVQGRLRDPEPELREQAAELLAQWSNEKSLILLYCQFSRESVDFVKLRIWETIQTIEKDRIGFRIDSNDKDQTMEAIQQLTEITHSPDWTISELVELADEHGETYIRQEALRALGNMGEKSEEAVVDIQRIGAKFNDGLETKETAQVSAEVVEKIWRAIDKKKVAVGYQKLTSPCFATRAEGVEVWTEVALRRPKWSGVQRLVDLLFRPNDDEWQYLQTHPEMRTAITDALGRFGEHQKYRAAYDALVKVTENENEELMVRLQALDGVVRIRGLHPFDNLPLPDKLPPVPTTTSAPAAVVPTRPARPAPQPLVVPAPRPQVTPAPAPQIAPVPAPQVTPAPAPEVTPAPEPKVSKPPKPTEPPKPTPEAPKQEAKGVKVPADKPRPRPEEAKPEPEPEPEPEPKPKPKPTEEPPVVSGPEPVPAERTEEPAKKTGEEDKEEPVGKSVVPTQAKIGPIPVSTIVICACIILAIALVVLISWPFIKYIYSRWRVWRKKGRGPAPKPPAKKKAPPKSSTPTKPSAPSAKVK